MTKTEQAQQDWLAWFQPRLDAQCAAITRTNAAITANTDAMRELLKVTA